MTTESRSRATSAYKLWIVAALLSTYTAVIALAYGRLREPEAPEPTAPAPPASTPRPGIATVAGSTAQASRPMAKAPRRAPRVRTRSS